MTYRVVIDYGNIELTVMVFSGTSDREEIFNSTMNHLETEGFILPNDNYPAITITPAPEWDEE